MNSLKSFISEQCGDKSKQTCDLKNPQNSLHCDLISNCINCHSKILNLNDKRPVDEKPSSKSNSENKFSCGDCGFITQ